MTGGNIVDVALRATFLNSPWAPALATIAGLATSVGPCAAPRWMAMAALCGTGGGGRTRRVAYALGLVGAYAALGTLASSLATLGRLSQWLYAAVALAMAIGGFRALLHVPSPSCSRASRASLPTATASGIACALVLSPCCTPLLGAAAGLTLATGDAARGALLAACFGLGHVAPVALAGAFVDRANGILERRGLSFVPTLVNGAVMLGSALYYGVLA